MRLHRVRYCLLTAVLLLGLSRNSRADFQVTKLGDSVVDAEALTIRGAFGQCINGLAFQQDAVVTHQNHQYVAYYDAKRRVCLARRRLPDGDWQVVRFEDYAFKSNDALWHHIELPMVAGNRPKLFMDKEDNAYLVYSDAWSHGIFFPKGSLIIAAATADSRWKDWKIIHTEKGPYLNEMLGDVYRWKSKGVLSVMAQESPKEVHKPTALRVIDFVLCTFIASAAETKYRDGRPAETLRMDAKDHGIVLRYGDGPDQGSRRAMDRRSTTHGTHRRAN